MAKINSKFLEEDTAAQMLALKKIVCENSLVLLEMQAASTIAVEQSMYMVRDIFVDANGYLNTIDTINTSAFNSSSKYTNTHSTSEITEGHGVTLNAIGSYSSSYGMKIIPTKALSLKKVTKYTNVTATRCRVWSDNNNNYGTLLATATFSGNIATLSTPVTLTIGTTYIIEVDNNGSNYTSYQAAVTTPIVENDFSWYRYSTHGVGGSNYVLNIASITYSLLPGDAIVQTNVQTLEFTPTHCQIFAWREATSGTGSFTADISFDNGAHFQTGIELNTDTAIINQGSQMVLKLNLNAGASNGLAEASGYGVMFW